MADPVQTLRDRLEDLREDVFDAAVTLENATPITYPGRRLALRAALDAFGVAALDCGAAEGRAEALRVVRERTEEFFPTGGNVKTCVTLLLVEAAAVLDRKGNR